MAHALVFHSAADTESVKALLVGLNGLPMTLISGAVPVGVQFGGRVVMVWSRQAAALYADGSMPALPRGSLILRLDDHPLPAGVSSEAAVLQVVGDGADALRLEAALSKAPLGGASSAGRSPPARGDRRPPGSSAPARPPAARASARSLVFYNAADSESLNVVLSGLGDSRALPIAAPVPAGVRFGGRVVLVWSAHAAESYAAAPPPPLPRDTVVVCVDDTPLPPVMTTDLRVLRLRKDASNAAQVQALMASEGGVRPQGGPVAMRPLPAVRRPAVSPLRSRELTASASPARARAASRRQAQSASVVLSASAFGTLTAVALGSVFPADTIVTPSFAATPDNESTSYLMAEQAEAHARQVAATAAFQGVVAPNVASVTFSADEMQALTQRLEQSDQELSAARAWSDGFINRLQGLSARAPDAMPAMGAVPRGPSTSASAPAAAEAPALAQAEPAADSFALRDRFTQVEPMAHPVDRIADIASAAPPMSRDGGA